MCLLLLQGIPCLQKAKSFPPDYLSSFVQCNGSLEFSSWLHGTMTNLGTWILFSPLLMPFHCHWHLSFQSKPTSPSTRSGACRTNNLHPLWLFCDVLNSTSLPVIRIVGKPRNLKPVCAYSYAFSWAQWLQNQIKPTSWLIQRAGFMHRTLCT